MKDLLLILFCIAAVLPAQARSDEAEQLFVRRIAPLFHEKCLACHGNDEAKISGGLDMRTLATLLKGGESGTPGLIVGEPEESSLYLAVTRQHDDWSPMPPKEADKLYAEQISWIKDWISGGAPWPDQDRMHTIAKKNEAKWSLEDGIVVKTSGGLSLEWTNRKYKPEGIWAYQPVKKPTPPANQGNPIDAFIGAKMAAGLMVAPAADRVTLIRRATFDLIGLPPKPEEVDAFVKDSRPDAEAFAAVIERLLESPHYGERMAQHWLDVTRYADSSGFSNDFERGNAWRYRDYVVRSFNADKRYDQFVREQIAGDEMEETQKEERGRRKVEGEGRKVEGEGRKVEGEGRKVEGERRKVEGERRKVEGEGRKVEGEGRKVEGEGRKVEGERRKVEGASTEDIIPPSSFPLPPSNIIPPSSFPLPPSETPPSELLIATGFLRMGPWELTGMEVARIARQRFLDDVTNSVGETFLAHSLQCARCHDHKFDPIPTRDYYSLQSVFATTQIAERVAPFLSDENTSGFEEKRFLELRRDEHMAELAELDEVLLRNAQQWFVEQKKDATQWNEAVDAARSKSPVSKQGFSNVFASARDSLTKRGVAESEFPPKLVGFTPEQFGLERVARKGLERLKWELDRYEPVAFSVYDGRTPQVVTITSPFRMPANRMTVGDLEETCVLTGGDPFGSGEKVKPGVLSVLAAAQQSPIPDAIEGRRLAFADWVASAENPLTTRTIVNRIWLWHFDQPIAGNPNNFGSTGKKPTHPELLDWLAATFVEKGWSFKAMHRVIMNSEVYRRSATHPDLKSLADRDPTGTSYAVFKPRRLTAEELRDAMLTVTDELNPALGGIPNRPEINLEAALQPRQVMGTFAAAWTPNPLPKQRHRRSLYALKIRGLPDPLQEVFNAPAPDFSCERREASTVTPQVFSLFNGQSTQSRSLALANRVVKETRSDEEAIVRLFMLTFSRPPRADELRSCIAHWRDIEALLGDEVPTTQKPPLEVRRDAIEENTGEKFTFNEKLHAYAEFVPDLQPSEVPAHTRALADVCLALVNSNEFAYVY